MDQSFIIDIHLNSQGVYMNFVQIVCLHNLAHVRAPHVKRTPQSTRGGKRVRVLPSKLCDRFTRLCVTQSIIVNSCSSFKYWSHWNYKQFWIHIATVHSGISTCRSHVAPPKITANLCKDQPFLKIPSFVLLLALLISNDGASPRFFPTPCQCSKMSQE